MKHERFVIIGASLAGASAAAALREGGFDGTVELIGAEPQLPYNRPPLSKGYLRGQERFEDQLVNPADYYTAARHHAPPRGPGHPGRCRAESRRPGRRRGGAVRPAPGRHGRAESDAYHPRRGAPGHLSAADGGGLRPHSRRGPLRRARGGDRPRLHRLRGVGVSPPDGARGHRHRGPPGAPGPCPRQPRWARCWRRSTARRAWSW